MSEISESPADVNESGIVNSINSGIIQCRLLAACLDTPITKFISSFPAECSYRYWLQPRPSRHRYEGKTFGTISGGGVSVPDGAVIEEAIFWGTKWQAHVLADSETPTRCRIAHWLTIDARSPLSDFDLMSGAVVQDSQVGLVSRDSFMQFSGPKNRLQVRNFFDGSYLKWFYFV